MTNLPSVLQTLIPISLEEMEHVKLLDRIDTKYIIHEDQLEEYLKAIGSQYKLLVISGKSVHPYETLYFDTPDFHLYYMHHSGILNRYKLRCRKYVNSGISFFEVKSKTNTSRTIKNRIQIDDIPETLNQTLNQYITDHTPGVYHDYVPVLRVFFDRITLVNNLASERLTFDINLRYKRNGIEKKLMNMVIVEVKQEKHTVSPLRELMKTNRQSQDYMSKYCMGLTCLNKGLKKNRFKQKINTLNKLGYEIH
jgi:hypothetical protein